MRRKNPCLSGIECTCVKDVSELSDSNTFLSLYAQDLKEAAYGSKFLEFQLSNRVGARQTSSILGSASNLIMSDTCSFFQTLLVTAESCVHKGQDFSAHYSNRKRVWGLQSLFAGKGR